MIDPEVKEHLNVLWLVEREERPRSCAYFAGKYSEYFHEQMTVQHLKNLLADLIAEGLIEADKGKRRGNYTRKLYHKLIGIPVKLKTSEIIEE